MRCHAFVLLGHVFSEQNTGNYCDGDDSKCREDEMRKPLRLFSMSIRPVVVSKRR